jgi:cbb3-type cytochrome oxidase subunit 3
MKNLATAITLILFVLFVAGSIWSVWRHEADNNERK